MRVGDAQSEAHIYFKSNGVFSGLPYAEGSFIILIFCNLIDFREAIFQILGVTVEWRYQV
jgi:hypothetical protein